MSQSLNKLKQIDYWIVNESKTRLCIVHNNEIISKRHNYHIFKDNKTHQ